MVKFKKVFFSIILVLLSMTYLSSSPAWAEDPPPPIAGEYGIAIDAVTGEVLYNKNADVQAYPASMTKVLTAIVLDEKAIDAQMFNVSPNAAGQECSCFGLTAGEQISKKDAMFGLLLLSANDLAVSIAENIGGSVEGFAQLMNEEVKKLGLQHTHFVTPNGLHDPNHYTTAHDMALIMKEAIKHPEVLDALSTQSVSVHTSVQDKIIRNKSEVHTQPAEAHVIAGKTGFTDQAGNTLVEYLKDGDKQVISVVMKSHKKEEYSDIQAMANYAFAHMKAEKVASKGEVVDKAKINGQKVDLIATDDAVVTMKNDDNCKLETKIKLVKTNGEIVKEGQIVGNMDVLKDGIMVKQVPLATDQVIKEIKKSTDGLNKSTDSSKDFIIPVGILISLFILVPLTMQNRKKMIRK